jgi:hypothetical protein
MFHTIAALWHPSDHPAIGHVFASQHITRSSRNIWKISNKATILWALHKPS